MSRTFGNAAPGGGIGVRMMVPLIDVSRVGSIPFLTATAAGCLKATNKPKCNAPQIPQSKPWHHFRC
jgi:hypothetical protein